MVSTRAAIESAPPETATAIGVCRAGPSNASLNSSSDTGCASGTFRFFEALRGAAEDARVRVRVFRFDRAKRRTAFILLPKLQEREPEFQHSVGRFGRLRKALEHIGKCLCRA